MHLETSEMDSSNESNGCLHGLSDLHSNFFNYPSDMEGIEDIDHPAWVSSSFSESCGSCLSKISSLCLDDKNKESPESSKWTAQEEVEAALLKPSIESDVHPGDESVLQEDHSTYKEDNADTISGSCQSLSSSSKTIYASPRSNSNNMYFSSLTKPGSGQKLRQRRGSLYRERAPSENALDFINLKTNRETKLSQSLHDVSCIPSNGLRNPSMKSKNVGTSLSALYSRNRSRDSGFIRSESLLSVSSGSRNYDHVESKVKMYIQNLKDAAASRRKERASPKVNTSSPVCQEMCAMSPDDPDMILLVQRMKNDLDEKDHLLSKAQEDYMCLLAKYAEAENKIDKLRFGVSHPKNCEPRNSSQILKRPQEVMHEVDQYSLASSSFASIFSPESSIQFENDKSKVHKERERKVVLVSAPLRPISSLYCTSVRLDKVVTPLNAKTSVGAPSMSSSGGHHRNTTNISMKKSTNDTGIQDVTIREGTTDTGIESCCPLSTEGLSATCMPHKTESISLLPPEDPILKVQRWQKSLPSSSQPSSVFSMPHQLNHEQSHGKAKSKVTSIGIQVHEMETLEMPSLSSGMSTPMVPCLNLGELSTGCTDDFSASIPVSEGQKINPINQVSSGCNSVTINSSSGPGQSQCSMPFQSQISNLETSTPSKHTCQGVCEVCGCKMKLERKYVAHKPGHKKKSKDISSLPYQPQAHQKHKFAAQLNDFELSQLLSILRYKDQDHVVPASPEEEKSCQDSFRLLEKKLKLLRNVVSLPTMVKLFDSVLENAISRECAHHGLSAKGDATKSNTSQALETPAPPECSEDSSLLQCLEELDEYTNQVWAKTESFLEVLNSNKC